MRDLLNDAVHEIRDLRRQNEILLAKVETMDLLACFLHTSPATRSQGMAPNVEWALQQKIDELDMGAPVAGSGD